VIKAKAEVGLSAQRIYQDLVGENGFTDSYQSVKRFVRKLPSRSGSGVWNANREKNSSWAWERRSMTAKVGNAAVGSCGWY
jgi:hypothetical protein